MRVELYANQEIDEGVFNEVNLSQNEVEYLGDFAELVLQFARSVGYTYVKQVVFIQDDGKVVETVR